MSGFDSLSGFSLPILFLKATVKKQVFVPQYVKRNGQVVAGHQAFVHVSDSHDEHKIMQGGGSHSQKAAHAKLTKHDWFNALPHDHQVPILLEHATVQQDKASAAAVLSTFKKKVLAGQAPTNAEWKAYYHAAPEKKTAICEDLHGAGLLDSMIEDFDKWKSSTPASAVAPAAVAPAAPVAAAPDPAPAPVPAAGTAPKKPFVTGSFAAKGIVDSIEQAIDSGDAAPIVAALALIPNSDKLKWGKVKAYGEAALAYLGAEPAAASAPPADHLPVLPVAAPALAGHQALLAKVQAAKLSESNTNHKPVNQKLQAIHDALAAGDAKTLLMHGHGSNTYAHKAVKLANEALAALGSPHQVAAGQKMGAHPGLSGAAPAAAVPAAPSKLVGATVAPAPAMKPVAAKPNPMGLPLGQPAAAPAVVSGKLFHNTEPGHNKFWSVGVHGSQLVTKYGKIGTKGTVTAKQYATPGEAFQAQNAIIALKVKGNYQLQGTTSFALDGAVPAAKPAPSKVVGATVVAAPAGLAAPVAPSIVGMSATATDAAIEAEAAFNSLDLDQLKIVHASVKGLHSVDFVKIANYTADAIAYLEAANGKAASGPKEGDTMQGVRGMLVLKDGHWVKMGTDPKMLKKLAASVPMPKFNGTNSINMGKIVKGLKALAETKGAAGLVDAVQSMFGTKMVVKAGGHGYKLAADGVSNSPNGNALVQYAKALQAAMEGTSGGTAPVQATAAPAPAAAHTPANKPTVASQNDSVFQSASSPLAMDGWKKTGPQQGYNEGGTYVDESGQAWYCKFPAGGEKVARNELLATRLYVLAGVATTSMRLISQGGKIGVASKIIPGANTNKAALLEGKADGLLSGFAVDAWLANWDTVGNNPAAGKGFDNILIDANGAAVRIDAGGALLYSGAGGKKQGFGESVIELKTMLDPNKNPNTAAVFGKMSQADITASVAKVVAIPNDQIIDFCDKFGPGSDADRKALAAKLIARKADMLSKYPLAGKKGATKVIKEKPDPTKLKVDANNLPPVHDFMTWNGTGKPISDKPYVLKNIHDEDVLKDFALQGNLVGLKDYKYAEVDKLTGAPTGVMLPIEHHPSNHVKAYHSDLVAALTSIAYPPEAARGFASKLADGILDLASKFPSKALGSTVANVPASERLAFWMALGAVANVDDFRPKHMPLITNKAKAAAKVAYSNLSSSSLARRFINQVQSSGSYNDYFRDGKTTDSQGTDLNKMNKEIHAYATEQPAGMTIHKWINMSAAQVQAVVASPDGTIFENSGSMCCSTSPTATSGFGKHRIVIRYAPGARGVDSFGSGNFGSEAEITTLPGARYMILSSKMVHCPVKGTQRLELEVLMLPPDPTYLASLVK